MWVCEEDEKRPCRRTASRIVTTRRCGPLTASDGAAVRIAARDWLPLMSSGMGTVHRWRMGFARGFQGDLIRTDAKKLSELAKLGYLGNPPATFPEVDGLGLDADSKR